MTARSDVPMEFLSVDQLHKQRDGTFRTFVLSDHSVTFRFDSSSRQWLAVSRVLRARDLAGLPSKRVTREQALR